MIKDPTVYSQEEMSTAIMKNRQGHFGHYGLVDLWLRQAFEAFPICGDDVLIIGSVNQGHGPWYEAMAVVAMAQNITVTDYNPTVYEESSYIKYVAPDDLPYQHFDHIISISTFEHSGLGRYGDPIDPDGDLKAMEWARKLLKPEGKLFLSVPIGKDKVVLDRHRYYGPERIFKLLRGWNMLDSFGFVWKELWTDRDWGSESEKGYMEYGPVLVLTPTMKGSTEHE